ncbi:MAG TPA: VOC family protein [Saprospiraceae bacterium]|nr:VOC family protein [Saprospiraceae bacterium]
MTFRIARHTTDLLAIEIFYTSIVGLQKLGGFQNHDGYDGIFLGHPHQDWHLEFTSSGDAPDSRFDDDDCLVFYVNSKIELAEIKDNLAKQNIATIEPKNPYWKVNGLMIADPDGYKIIFALKDLPLNSDDELTQLVRTKNIDHWSDLLDYVKALPYGRNAQRDDFSLVLKEEQGSCSSKHAFLKKVAQLNHISNVKLIMGIYKMNHLNTPKIGNTILENGLDYIPEAHCYLMINNRRYDLTSANASIHHLIDDVLEEKEIEPEQVNIFKVNYHKDFIKKWIAEGATDLSFERVWDIREACITKLGE